MPENNINQANLNKALTQDLFQQNNKLQVSKGTENLKSTQFSKTDTGSQKEAGKGEASPKLPDQKTLESIKDSTNAALARLNIKLDINIDPKLEQTIVKVSNRETGETIRQIPPEEMLDIAKRMEEMSGVLLDRWS